jgi:hypothetical protein
LLGEHLLSLEGVEQILELKNWAPHGSVHMWYGNNIRDQQ